MLLVFRFIFVYFRVFSNSNGSVTSISFRFRSTRDGREGYLLANVIPNLLLVFKYALSINQNIFFYLNLFSSRVLNANGKISVRKRFVIRQKSLSIHSSFCPIISQRQGFCVVSASEDMCGKKSMEKFDIFIKKLFSSLSL